MTATGVAPAEVRTQRAPRAPLPAWAGGVIGVVGLVVVWWILAVTVLSNGQVLPTPWEIVHQLYRDRKLYPPNLSATLTEAGFGWLLGNGLAILLAVGLFGIPVMEKVLLQIGVASYCLPIIALGPILAMVFSGNAPKIALAAISVFFTTMTGMLLGLRGADQASLDLVRAYGGGGAKQMRYVRMRGSLPSLFAALKIAAPAAILGAIVGEFLGADQGLGVAMVNAEQALEVSRTWGIALVASAISGIGFGLTSLVGTLLTPWAPRTIPGGNR